MNWLGLGLLVLAGAIALVDFMKTRTELADARAELRAQKVVAQQSRLVAKAFAWAMEPARIVWTEKWMYHGDGTLHRWFSSAQWNRVLIRCRSCSDTRTEEDLLELFSNLNWSHYMGYESRSGFRMEKPEATSTTELVDRQSAAGVDFFGYLMFPETRPDGPALPNIQKKIPTVGTLRVMKWSEQEGAFREPGDN